MPLKALSAAFGAFSANLQATLPVVAETAVVAIAVKTAFSGLLPKDENKPL